MGAKTIIACVLLALATVLVGTFVSVVTLTAMMWLIRSGQLIW